MYIFLDTETTGLNKSSDRVVQIAWLTVSEDGKELCQHNRLIKPSGFEIPPAAEKIHGISTNVAKRFGVPLRQALLDFARDVDACKVIVGHNLSFDIAMLRPEFSRENIEFRVDGKNMICTMRSSTAWCRLPKLDGRSGFKWPKLDELHYRLFGRYFEGAHDALADVLATKEVYFELIKREVIPKAKIPARVREEFSTKKESGKKSEVKLRQAIHYPTSTEKTTESKENSRGNAESTSDVFSWNWSAPGGEEIGMLACPSCQTHCKHKINARRRAARCLTCFAEYNV